VKWTVDLSILLLEYHEKEEHNHTFVSGTVNHLRTIDAGSATTGMTGIHVHTFHDLPHPARAHLYGLSEKFSSPCWSLECSCKSPEVAKQYKLLS